MTINVPSSGIWRFTIDGGYVICEENICVTNYLGGNGLGHAIIQHILSFVLSSQLGLKNSFVWLFSSILSAIISS